MRIFPTLALVILLCSSWGCSPRVYGTVRMLDEDLTPIAADRESPEGTIINFINTSTSLEQASRAVTVNPDGTFQSGKDELLPGAYKIEASRMGFLTETVSVELSRFFRKKVNFAMRKIPEGRRKSIDGTVSEQEKIIHPGEVNIQPPML